MSEYSIDYDRDVWANQRARIRKLGTSSVHYRLLKALTKPIVDKGDDLNALSDELYLATCPNDRLWVWGERLSVSRDLVETDEQYRYRLLDIKYVSYGSVSEQIGIISRYSGIPASEIIWEKMPEGIMVIGGTINSKMASRQLSFLSRRFYVPVTSGVDWDYIIAKLQQYIKGGEMFEIIEVA